MVDAKAPVDPIAKRSKVSRKMIVREFLRCFCGAKWEELAPLLDPEVKVTGPLGQWQNKREYLTALQNDPPVPCCYTVESLMATQDVATVFYQYHKLGGSLRVAQMFHFHGALIADMVWVFDAREVKASNSYTLNGGDGQYAGL